MTTETKDVRRDAGGEGDKKPHAHEITITINNRPFTTTERELTGLALKQLGGVPADYELFRVQGANSVAVGNEQTVHLHEREEFRAIPAGTFGN